MLSIATVLVLKSFLTELPTLKKNLLKNWIKNGQFVKIMFNLKLRKELRLIRKELVKKVISMVLKL